MGRERRRRGLAPREPAGSVEDTTTHAFPDPPTVGRWARDVLGEGFEARTLPLDDDEEGEVVATIVRHTRTSKRPVPHAVLYLHGWSDYFFQSELAEYWTERGAAFYALDLRKYGRSLRVHQTAGFVESLRDRKSTRLNSSHVAISYAVFCLKKKTNMARLGTVRY